LQKPRRVVVVGAGVVGASLAWSLAARAASVTVLETDVPGVGTSATSFVWVNASSKLDDDQAYFDLNFMAMREHHVLASVVPGPTWFFPTGHIELAIGAPEVDALESKVARLCESGYAAELLSGDEIQRLEPGLDLPKGGSAAYYADEGWVDAPSMVRALVRFAEATGAEFVPYARVTDLIVANGAVTGVRLASGEVIDADVVVTAAGRWTQELLAPIDVEIPLVATDHRDSEAVGLLVSVRPADGSPYRVLHSHGVSWVPQPRGRAMLASPDGDVAAAREREPDTLRANAEALLEQATALNPHFAGAAIEGVRVGFRALPIDGRTVCGWVDSVDGLYVVVTHSGITLAPLLSEMVSCEVVDGEAVPQLDRFRPGRFSAVEG
jgi:glycine/D-amino acid oxidase-like deaminating enzyme